VKQISNSKIAAVIAVLGVLSVCISGCISQSGYEFVGGVSHPKEINDLLKNGTVVLYFWKNNCPECDKMKPTVANLESQYNGTNVTIRRINIEQNATNKDIGKNYGVTGTPTTIVIRGDGAIAKFVGTTEGNTLKSAIEDARKWR
jgi:thiol-disulfide isomerase/thioredoxin